MKEQFKRELNRTYIVFDSEEVPYEETYEVEMLLQNELQNILPIRVLRTNGHLQMLYDVSAKQSLKDCAQRSKLSAETLRSFFEAIEQLTKEVKNYLLDMDCVVLDLEHIYVQERSFYFCYCPWEKREILSAFREMLEELLGNLDYRDAEGVELAYHFYQSACKGNFCIAEILAEHCSKEAERFPEVTEVVFPEEKDSSMEPQEEKEEQNRQKKGLAGLFLKLFGKKEKEKVSYGEQTALRWEPCKLEEERSYRKTETVLDGNTVFLTKESYCRWKLRPVSSEYETFRVAGESFLVGKKKDCVDGYIGKDTISRIHSRLTVEEGRLYVADANSTNGTFVNGRAIEPGETVEIFDGDRILFADVEYECYNSL